MSNDEDTWVSVELETHIAPSILKEGRGGRRHFDASPSPPPLHLTLRSLSSIPAHYYIWLWYRMWLHGTNHLRESINFNLSTEEKRSSTCKCTGRLPQIGSANRHLVCEHSGTSEFFKSLA
jgi:hypothetical protein